MSPEKTKHAYLLQAIDLKKHYPVKKAYLVRSGWSKRWMVSLLTWSAEKHWPWWGVRLRQIHVRSFTDYD